jgi:hypothetical protein
MMVLDHMSVLSGAWNGMSPKSRQACVAEGEGARRVSLKKKMEVASFGELVSHNDVERVLPRHSGNLA